MKFKVGNRVTRPLFMEDGTWLERGDSCLPESPLLHGTVIELGLDTQWGARERQPMVKVRWDETFKESWYFEHGLTLAHFAS